MMRILVVFCAACLLAASAEAQSWPTGYVSAFVDGFPNHRDDVELRARVFAEQKLAPADNVRVVLSGFSEGLLARRAGTRVEDAIFRVQDASVEVTAGRVDLLAGFTRVAWGRLDELQPTDVVNPLDVSRFFFEGRSEARMPVALVRGRLFITEAVTIEGIYVPVFRRGRFDQLDERTAPFNLTPPAGVVDVREPRATAANAQGGVRFSATSGRVDWSVSAYRGFDSFGLYSLASPLVPLTTPAPGAVPPPRAVRRFPRFTMVGADFETVFGEWGVRGEAAAFTEDTFQDAASSIGGRSWDAGAGVDRKAGEYRISGTVLVHREVYDRAITVDGARVASRTDVSLIASADRSFARERYAVRVFGVYAATDASGFVRTIATAKLRDDLAFESSVGWFAGEGPGLIGRYTERDFAYARLKYYF